MENQLGYVCPVCETFNKADGYAAAHSHIDLNHHCKCGTINIINNWEVIKSINTKTQVSEDEGTK